MPNANNRTHHICFVAPYAYLLLTTEANIPVIGGAELQQVTVARALAARGYRVSMVCLDFGQIDKITIDGITIHRAYRPDEGLPVLRFLWPRLTRMWGCLARVDADIYYQRAAGMLTGIVAAFCKRYHKKSLFAVASNFDFTDSSVTIRYKRDRWLYEYGVRHVDRVLVQNREQAKLCLQEFGRKSDLVPNCYPAPTVLPRKPGSEILWVSTIRRIKRPNLFLDLARALPEYRFTMVGGPAGDESRIYDLIRADAETLSNVNFIGFVPYSRIDEYFDRAALFLNTSESEGFPNTFLQAWARATPTISFFDCGARSDGAEVGQSVDSWPEMREAVENLMTNEDQREAKGTNCRRYVERHHSVRRVVDRYTEVFDELFAT